MKNKRKNRMIFNCFIAGRVWKDYRALYDWTAAIEINYWNINTPLIAVLSQSNGEIKASNHSMHWEWGRETKRENTKQKCVDGHAHGK